MSMEALSKDADKFNAITKNIASDINQFQVSCQRTGKKALDLDVKKLTLLSSKVSKNTDQRDPKQVQLSKAIKNGISNNLKVINAAFKAPVTGTCI